MLTVMFTMWHEGIHYQSFQTGTSNLRDAGGLDNGDKAEIELLGFNIGGRKSFIQYWNQGAQKPAVKPIPSILTGTTSWRNMYNFMNNNLGPLTKGPFVNPKGISGESLMKFGQKVGQVIQKIGKWFNGGEDPPTVYGNVRYLE